VPPNTGPILKRTIRTGHRVVNLLKNKAFAEIEISPDDVIRPSSIWNSYNVGLRPLSKSNAPDGTTRLTWDNKNGRRNATLRHVLQSCTAITGSRRLSCGTSSWWPSASACSLSRSATPMPAKDFEETVMMFDYTLAGLVSAGLLIYLTYALLRPERF